MAIFEGIATLPISVGVFNQPCTDLRYICQPLILHIDCVGSQKHVRNTPASDEWKNSNTWDVIDSDDSPLPSPSTSPPPRGASRAPRPNRTTWLRVPCSSPVWRLFGIGLARGKGTMRNSFPSSTCRSLVISYLCKIISRVLMNRIVFSGYYYSSEGHYYTLYVPCTLQSMFCTE